MPPGPDRRRLGLLVGIACLAVGVVLLGVAAVVWLSGRDDDAPPLRSALADALERAEASTEEFPGLTEVELSVGDRCLRLVVADAATERRIGLTGRSDLGPYDGMLFVFEEPSTSRFTMSGVPVPLDIGWYDDEGRPVDQAEMVPCPDSPPECPAYASDGPYRFALETLGGELPAGALGGCTR